MAQVSLHLTLGVLEIGYMVSGFLFGALTVQSIVYHRKFQHQDPWLTRCLVGTIWFLELGQLLTHFHGVYYFAIRNHGNLLAAALTPPRSVGVSFLLSCCVGPLVESFYVSRLFRLSKRLLPALIGWALAITRLAGWLYVSVHALQMHSLAQFTSDFAWQLETLFSASAFVDLAIALANCYYLAQSRKRARQGRLITVIDGIMAWTLQTGLTTSVSFIVTLLCFVFSRPYLIWVAVSSALTKVFSNCLLASLNARVVREPESPNSPLPQQQQQQEEEAQNQTILSFVAGSPDVNNYGQPSPADILVPPPPSRADSHASRRDVYWAI